MFKAMALGTKIALGFGLVLVFLGGVGVTGYMGMHTATETVGTMVNQLEIVKEINTTMSNSQDAQAGSLRFIMYDDDKYHNIIQEQSNSAVEHARNAKSLMKSAENRANSDAAINQINAYLAANKEWKDLQVRRRDAGEIRAQASATFQDTVKNLLSAQEEAIKASAREMDGAMVADYGVTERTLKVQKVRDCFNEVRVWARKYELAVTPEAQSEITRQWVSEIDATQQTLTECNAVIKDPTALKRVDECLVALSKYAGQAEAYRQISHQQHEIQLNKMRPAAEALIAKAGDVRDGVYTFIDNAQKESNASMSFASLLIVSIGTGALIVGVLCALFITRAITKPLNRIIVGLNEGADQVNDAASQVASASQQLAEGASEQASSLEETSSALEEMAAMTRTNAQNAKEANGLSGQARDAAQSGDQTMDRLNGAMSAINDSSGQISKIIKVIEEIAFQTNLLALNAAVEAARAGEHGKGFAVVADEVRNLAQRSAQAARETTDLIEDSVKKAKEGADVAGDVGKALGTIVSDVSKVTELINGIAQASGEQAQGVDQVNTAVSQMDKVTQQNASGAEESASAAEELSAQATTVKSMVDELAGIVGGNRGSTIEVTKAAAPTSKKSLRAASVKKETHVAAGSFAGGRKETRPAAGHKATDDEPMPMDGDNGQNKF